MTEPLLPPHLRKTYQIKAPISTHWRPATCEEVDCPHYLQGWLSAIDETTELGQRQAHYIRHDSGRKFVETRGYEFPDDPMGQRRIPETLTVFRFEAGQKCFGADTHKLPVGKPELYLLRGGDHRGNPRQEITRFSGHQAWLDDFGEHQERIADAVQRG